MDVFILLVSWLCVFGVAIASSTQESDSGFGDEFSRRSSPSAQVSQLSNPRRQSSNLSIQPAKIPLRRQSSNFSMKKELTQFRRSDKQRSKEKQQSEKFGYDDDYDPVHLQSLTNSQLEKKQSVLENLLTKDRRVSQRRQSSNFSMKKELTQDRLNKQRSESLIQPAKIPLLRRQSSNFSMKKELTQFRRVSQFLSLIQPAKMLKRKRGDLKKELTQFRRSDKQRSKEKQQSEKFGYDDDYDPVHLQSLTNSQLEKKQSVLENLLTQFDKDCQDAKKEEESKAKKKQLSRKMVDLMPKFPSLESYRLSKAVKAKKARLDFLAIEYDFFLTKLDLDNVTELLEVNDKREVKIKPLKANINLNEKLKFLEAKFNKEFEEFVELVAVQTGHAQSKKRP